MLTGLLTAKGMPLSNSKALCSIGAPAQALLRPGILCPRVTGFILLGLIVPIPLFLKRNQWIGGYFVAVV